MRMILKAMHIANFKGISELDIDFGSAYTRISGPNGAGKSTIADAFSWVLFNKDSHGNAPGSDNFHEKPLDEFGEERHNLDTSVELICTVDGQRFDVKRVQRENWVKKRGGSVESFQGNVSSYYINDVEVKLSELKSRIAQIADEQLFQLLGTLKAFNSLDWRKRREQLISLSGEGVDAQLLTQSEFAELAAEIQARNVTVDELRKVIADQRKRINDELKMMPVRIDEAKSAIVEYSPAEIADAHYIIKDAQETIARIDRQIAEAGTAASNSEAARHRLELQMEIAKLRQSVLSAHTEGKSALQSELSKRMEEQTAAWLRLKEAQKAQQQLADELEYATRERNTLREQYCATKDAPLGVAAGQACPTCGQLMPEAMIDQMLARARQKRKAECDAISAKGKELKARCEALQAKVDALAAQIAELTPKADAAQKASNAVLEKIRVYPAEPDYSAEPHIAELETELAGIQEPEGNSQAEQVKALEERRAELNRQIAAKQQMLAQNAASEKTRQRLKAHEERQAELGKQLTRADMLTELLEEFVQQRCRALESGINSHFKSVRWKLFDTQINGGVVDTCVAMIPCDGTLVSFETANTAAQINASIEIVDALSGHYDVHIPLFIDGAESVVALERADTQMITLSVRDCTGMMIDTEEETEDGNDKLSA